MGIEVTIKNGIGLPIPLDPRPEIIESFD